MVGFIEDGVKMGEIAIKRNAFQKSIFNSPIKSGPTAALTHCVWATYVGEIRFGQLGKNFPGTKFEFQISEFFSQINSTSLVIHWNLSKRTTSEP